MQQDSGTQGHCGSSAGQLQAYLYSADDNPPGHKANICISPCSGSCCSSHLKTNPNDQCHSTCDTACVMANCHLDAHAALTAGKHSQCVQITASSCCSSRCSCDRLHTQLQHSATTTATVACNVSSVLTSDSQSPVTTRIYASGICCPMESRLIHSILDNIPGVVAVDVTVVTKAVTVLHEPTAISPAALVAALNSCGLQATLNTRGVSSDTAISGTPAKQQHSGMVGWLLHLQQHPLLPPFPMLASGTLLLVNLMLLVPSLSAAAVVKQGLLALCAAVVGIPPVLRKAWAALRNRSLDMNCLVVVALFGAVGLGEWYEAGALVFLFILAEWLEERCVSRAAGALEDILRLQPETALVVVEAAQHEQHRQLTDIPGDNAAVQATEKVLEDGQQQQQQQQQPDRSHQHQHKHRHCCQLHLQHEHKCADIPGDKYHTHSHSSGSHGDLNKHQADTSNKPCCAAADAADESRRLLSSVCCNAAADVSCTVNSGSHNHDQQQPHHQQQRQQWPQLMSMPAVQLHAGTLVLVRPGDKVPVDGLIEHGISVLDEAIVTGESRPISKSVGDAVLAGTVNCGSMALKIRATAAAGDSTVARLAALMEAAAASKSKHDVAVERFAKFYTPLVVLVALVTAAVGSAVQPIHWREWVYLSLVVLVTGCPCALVISTPVASVAGLTRAARKGVLIKGGRYLELLGNLSAVSFDKSGTLTEGHFQLTQLQTFHSFTQQQALQLAAALEQHSNHPVAHAIVGAAGARGCITAEPVKVCHIQEIAGKGIVGEVMGQRVAVCSWAHAQELVQHQTQPQSVHTHEQVCVCDTPEPEEVDCRGYVDHAVKAGVEQVDAGRAAAAASGEGVKQQQQQGGEESEAFMAAATASGATAVCLVVDQQVAAVLLLSDKPREDAWQALQELQELGVRCSMLTGDNPGAAAHIAGQLGMKAQDVHAQLLPHHKLQLLDDLRHKMAQHQSLQQQRCSGLGALLRKRLSSNSSRQPAHCPACTSTEFECVFCIPQDSSRSRRNSGVDLLSKQGAGVSCSSSSSSSRGVYVAHVGDGVNDAPALAAADVGIAMGVAGAALAVGAADVALFSNNLASLPFAVRLGRRSTWIVVVNTAFACGIKVAVLACAVAGVASLWMSLLADVGSSLLVTLHALSLLRFEAHDDDHDTEKGGCSPPSLSSSGSSHGDLLMEGAVDASRCCLNGSNADRMASSHQVHTTHRTTGTNRRWSQLLMLLSGGANIMSHLSLGQEAAAPPAATPCSESFICSKPGRAGSDSCTEKQVPAETRAADRQLQLAFDRSAQQQQKQLSSRSHGVHHHGCSGGCCPPAHGD